ncbi:MAG: hypothetical protein USCGTAYLOR_02773 [Chromatiales bacterium USCg_Taylor]|nr:MAG: hypothetical protein USCGTAYLOR_02773 [Chromatiales bacterium USCg_Taylor]
MVLVGPQVERLRLELRAAPGQFSSGIGEGFWRLSFLNAIVFARALLRSVSPLRPMRFGVAFRPTQRPISNGHLPSFSTSWGVAKAFAQLPSDPKSVPPPWSCGCNVVPANGWTATIGPMVKPGHRGRGIVALPPWNDGCWQCV